MGGIKMTRPIPPSHRFWEKVHKTDTCWLWTASIGGDGYGQFELNRGMVRAHRYAWELTKGPIPKGMWVLHHCDNPLCVNPSHLFLGTHQDNMDNMVDRGRYRPGLTKLTETDILALRNGIRNGKRIVDLAEQFGVCVSTIYYHIDVVSCRRGSKGAGNEEINYEGNGKSVP